jgi:hypothetical protein
MIKVSRCVRSAGQGMVEYALIIGLLSIIILVGLWSFGPVIVDLYANHVVTEQDSTASISFIVYR